MAVDIIARGLALNAAGPGVPSVATVAALRAISGSGHTDGNNIILNGSASINDGSGGVYSWSSTSTAADDGFLVIKPNSISSGPGRWILIDGQILTGKAATNLTNVNNQIFRSKGLRTAKLTVRPPYATDTVAYAPGQLWGMSDGTLYMNQTVTVGASAWSQTDASNNPLLNDGEVLDIIGGVGTGAAYGVYRLSSTYAGPAFQIKRAIDSAVLDIGFVFCVIMTVPLWIANWKAVDDFLVGTTGVLNKWYDQGGNGYDSTADPTRPVAIGYNTINGLRVISMWGGGQTQMVIPAGLSLNRQAVSIFISGLSESVGHTNAYVQLGTDTNFANNLLITTGARDGRMFAIGNNIAIPCRMESTPSVLGFISSASATSGFCNDNSGATAVMSSNALVGGYIGAGVYGGAQNSAAWIDYAAVIIVGSAVSAATQQLARRSLNRSARIQPQSRDQLIILGDSIGVSADTPNQPWWRQAYPNLDRDFRVYNQSLEGTTIAAFIGSYAGSAGNLYVSIVDNIVIICAGSNDLAAMNVANGAATNAATLAGLVTSLENLLIGTGYPVANILVATLYPRNNSFSGGQTGAGFEAARLLFNAGQITARPGRIINYGGDPLMGNVSSLTNTALFVSALHPTQLGHSISAAYVAPTVNSLN